MSFKDKTVIVTGASGGIGGSIARTFGKEGANVVVNYLTRVNEANMVANDINNSGSRSLLIKADVSDPIQVSNMIDQTIENFKSIDVLINNASHHPPPLFDFNKPDWDFWKKMIHTNVMGILICSHYAASFLKDSNGNIINIVMDYFPGGLGYTLTKAACLPLTRGLAVELAPIRVNAIAPGAVDTWGMSEEEKKYFEKKSLLKRLATPFDIAKAVLFLASEKASFITGEIIHVDAGKQLLD